MPSMKVILQRKMFSKALNFSSSDCPGNVWKFAYKGSCYYYSNVSSIRASSQEVCKLLPGQSELVSLDSYEEAAFVDAMLKAEGEVMPFWTALLFSGAALYLNKSYSSPTFVAWDCGQPSNSPKAKNCVTAQPNKIYGWRSEDCFERRHLVCEKRKYEFLGHHIASWWPDVPLWLICCYVLFVHIAFLYTLS